MHTAFHSGILVCRIEDKKALLRSVLFLWVPIIMLAKWTFLLVVLILQVFVYYMIRIFEMYFS